MALYSLICADVPLRNYSLTRSPHDMLTVTGDSIEEFRAGGEDPSDVSCPVHSRCDATCAIYVRGQPSLDPHVLHLLQQDGDRQHTTGLFLCWHLEVNPSIVWVADVSSQSKMTI